MFIISDFNYEFDIKFIVNRSDFHSEFDIKFIVNPFLKVDTIVLGLEMSEFLPNVNQINKHLFVL